MRTTLATLLVLLLSACGFRLVGEGQLAPELHSVYVDMPLGYRVAEPPLVTTLRARLARRGAEVASRAERAEAVLRLTHLDERRETLSIGTDGKALEYRLVIGVRYELLRDGVALLPAGDLSVSRDYSFQLDQILQKELEEQQLREYIQNELAELVMLRLETGLAARRRASVPVQVVPAPEAN
jgi:LPS-assembly lipoprotein